MGGSSAKGDLPGKDGQPPCDAPEGVGVCLLLFARNEQDTIRETMRQADAALAAVAVAYEILIVDDGSTDATADAVAAEAVVTPRVRLLRQPRQRGRGAALRAGLQAATLDLVAVAPDGWQPNPNELAGLLPLTQRHDVVCGCASANGRRGLLGRGYDALAGLLLGVGVRNPAGTLKIFRREHLVDLLPECNNSFADTEILARAQRQGLSVAEVAVNRPGVTRGPSGRSWRPGARALAALVRFWWGHILFTAPEAESEQARGPLWLPLLLLALITGALLFPNLSYPLLEPDEGRYAEIGREMLVRSDWVVPTLNHEPYYDKPPLFYWLVAASLHFFGTHEWAARLVPTLAAFLTVLAAFFFGRRNFGCRAGFLAGLVLALMPVFVTCGRTLILDSLLALFVALALFTAYEAIRGRRLHWGWWTTSAACCALAVLTKGPVALILVGPPVVACAWLRRDGPRPGLVSWSAYLGVVVCVSAPWFVAVIARDRAFAYEFFVRHHLMRYLGEDFHAEPIWFYLPVLFVGCLPWSFLFPSLACFLFGRRWMVQKETAWSSPSTIHHPPSTISRPWALGFCLLSAGWCLLFFSLSRGKLPPYILPALPALAVLVGCHLEELLWGATTRAPGWAALGAPRVAVGVLAVAWLGIAAWSHVRGLTSPPAPRLLAEAILCVLFLLGAIWWGRRLAPRTAWALCAAFSFGFFVEVSGGLIPAWAARCSPVPRPAEIGQWLSDGETALVCWGDEWGSVTFHLERDRRFLCAIRCQRADVARFLSAHRRSLVITKDEIDAAHLRSALPATLDIQQVAQHPRTRLFLVSPGAPQASAAH
jgi:dolichol-phosphate mannosyltransferase